MDLEAVIQNSFSIEMNCVAKGHRTHDFTAIGSIPESLSCDLHKEYVFAYN